MKSLIMHMNPYLSFKGQCEAAFRFCERCPADATRIFHIFHALSEGGRIVMPIEKTFKAGRVLAWSSIASGYRG